MSAEVASTAGETTGATAPVVPKRITNAQTVCNERNEKNKLCNGHLKQLDTAGEPAEVHLRGDDVLSKCHLCGTLYMGPPLGHVRDPGKQKRFVEAELTVLLQAAGGTLPVIRKNEKGVYVLVEPPGAGHAAAAPAPKPAPTSSTAAQPTAAAKVVEKSTAAPPGPKAAAEPNRQLNRRSTYAGVVDTGPVPGETKEQKIARLQRVVGGAKQLSEEGGAVAVPASDPGAKTPSVAAAETAADLPPDAPPPTTPTPTTSHVTSAEPDRTLFRRSTYAGVVDTGPVPGETREQKIERLTKVVAGAKQKSEEGGN